MKRYWPENKKELSKQDLRIMNIPYEYWDAHMDYYPDDDDNNIDIIRRYLDNLYDVWENGLGLTIAGKNGTGKTAAACIILKEYRRYKQSCLYTRSEDLRKANFDKDFQKVNGIPLYAYAREVDVLLVDDLGKEADDRRGFSKYDLENLLRHRIDNKLITIFTTNMSPTKIEENYKKSTWNVLRSATHFVLMMGEDLRKKRFNHSILEED